MLSAMIVCVCVCKKDTDVDGVLKIMIPFGERRVDGSTVYM